MTTPDDAPPHEPKATKTPRRWGRALLSLTTALCVTVAVYAYAEPFVRSHALRGADPDEHFAPGPDWREPGYVYNAHEFAMVNVRAGLKACAAEDWKECAHQLRMAKADDPTLETNPDVVKAAARAEAALAEIAKRQPPPPGM